MENKAMYLHTVSDRDNSSIFEEPFDGRSLSKLNLCEDGECIWLHLTLQALPCPHTQTCHCSRAAMTPPIPTSLILPMWKFML